MTEYQMYEDTAEILAENMDIQQYEISNYAEDGYACAGIISGYWQRTEYLGAWVWEHHRHLQGKRFCQYELICRNTWLTVRKLENESVKMF